MDTLQSTRDGIRLTQPAEVLQNADFRVWSAGRGGWKVELVSPRARLWARSNFNADHRDASGTILSTDLAGANSLIHRARLSGLVSEYSGPLAPVRVGGTAVPRTRAAGSHLLGE